MSTKPLKKLLFVDDDEDTITLVQYCLETLKGVDIQYAYSGEEALQKAFQFLPDLIILDVTMPKVDGITVFKLVHQDARLATVPIIFFTAKVQKNEIESYFKLGIIDIIIKPFDPITLPSTILSIWKKWNNDICKTD